MELGTLLQIINTLVVPLAIYFYKSLERRADERALAAQAAISELKEDINKKFGELRGQLEEQAKRMNGLERDYHQIQLKMEQELRVIASNYIAKEAFSQVTRALESKLDRVISYMSEMEKAMLDRIHSAQEK